MENTGILSFESQAYSQPIGEASQKRLCAWSLASINQYSGSYMDNILLQEPTLTPLVI